MARLRIAALSFTVSLLFSGCYTQLRAPHARRYHSYSERHIPPQHIWHNPAPVFHLPRYDHHDWWLYGDSYCDIWIDRYYDTHPWFPRFGTYIHYDHHRRPGYGQVWHRSPIQWRPRWRHHGPRFEPLSPTIDVEIVVVGRRSRFRRDGFAGGVPRRGEDQVPTRTSGSSVRGPDGRPVETRTVRVTRPEKIKKLLMPTSLASRGDRPTAGELSPRSPSIDVETEVAGVRSRFRRDGFVGGVPGNTPGVPDRGEDIVTVRTSGSSVGGPDDTPDVSRTVRVTGQEKIEGSLVETPVSSGGEGPNVAQSTHPDWKKEGSWEIWGKSTQPKPQTNWYSPQADSRTGEPESPGQSSSETKDEGSSDWSWSSPKSEPQKKPQQNWTPAPLTQSEPTRSWSPPKVEKRPEPKPTRSWSPPKAEKRPEPKPSYSAPKRVERKREEVRRSKPSNDSRKSSSSEKKTTKKEEKKDREEKRRKSGRRRGK